MVTKRSKSSRAMSSHCVHKASAAGSVPAAVRTTQETVELGQASFRVRLLCLGMRCPRSALSAMLRTLSPRRCSKSNPRRRPRAGGGAGAPRALRSGLGEAARRFGGTYRNDRHCERDAKQSRAANTKEWAMDCFAAWLPQRERLPAATHALRRRARPTAHECAWRPPSSPGCPLGNRSGHDTGAARRAGRCAGRWCLSPR
jgi:hypothetical protein